MTLFSKKSSLYSLMPAINEIGRITTYGSGVDCVVEWKIDFFNLPERDGAEFYSPVFSLGGERWYLDILPNGSSKTDSSGHVNLGLSKYPTGHSMRLSFSLSLKTAKGEKYKEQHCTTYFENLYPKHRHAFRRFIPRSELLMKSSELVPEGVLTVVCTKKNTKSAESVTGTGNSENVGVNASTQTEEDSIQSLCEDYKKMLLCGHDHNLILKVGNKELQAHRDVLRARSRVFESMLDHDMKEKNTGIIDVPDCDPDAMELFLSYVYCGKIEALDHSNMLGLYYVADKYEMMELKRECCNFIKKSLSVTNICSVIQLALKHSDSDLLEYATGYFTDNMLDIMQTVEWQSFLKDNSTVGNELLIKSIKLKNARN